MIHIRASVGDIKYEWENSFNYDDDFSQVEQFFENDDEGLAIMEYNDGFWMVYPESVEVDYYDGISFEGLYITDEDYNAKIPLKDKRLIKLIEKHINKNLKIGAIDNKVYVDKYTPYEIDADSFSHIVK